MTVLSQKEAIVSGVAPGRTTITVWLTSGRRLLYAVVVEPNLETARAALSRAFRDPSFWCLFFGFFVCGVHVSFLTVHLPGFVHSCGLPLYVGAGAISLIGLFNIAGSLISGELTQKWKRRELLVGIYAARGVLMTAFLLMEKTTTSVMMARMILSRARLKV